MEEESVSVIPRRISSAAQKRGGGKFDSLGESEQSDFSVSDEKVPATVAQKAASYPTLVLLSVFAACLGAFSFGYHISVVNGPLDAILTDLGAKGNVLLGGWIVSISLATATPGSLCAGLVADKLGRKRAFQLAALPFVVGTLLSATAQSPMWMLTGRALAGAAFGLASCIVPIYISEVSPTDVRGRLGSVNQLAICVGILAALLAGLPLGRDPHWWRSMFALGALPPAAMAALFLTIAPESPRWLAKKGRFQEAEQCARKLLGSSASEDAVLELAGASSSRDSSKEGGQKGSSSSLVPSDAVGTEEEGRGRTGGREAEASWTDLFAKRYRRVVFIGTSLFFLQQFAGINAVVYYSSSVFRSVGIQSDVAASALVALSNVAGTTVASSLMDTQGRKKLITASFLGMAASMLLLSLSLSWSALQSFSPVLAVAGTIAYVLSFSLGAGPVPALLLSEIFPSSIRGNGVALSLGVHWICNFFIGLGFLAVVTAVGISTVYLAFAAVCIVAVVFIQRFVVETKGRSLEEIERMLVDAA